jgi:hypothetical protein
MFAYHHNKSIENIIGDLSNKLRKTKDIKKTDPWFGISPLAVDVNKSVRGKSIQNKSILTEIKQHGEPEIVSEISSEYPAYQHEVPTTESIKDSYGGDLNMFGGGKFGYYNEDRSIGLSLYKSTAADSQTFSPEPSSDEELSNIDPGNLDEDLRNERLAISTEQDEKYNQEAKAKLLADPTDEPDENQKNANLETLHQLDKENEETKLALTAMKTQIDENTYKQLDDAYVDSTLNKINIDYKGKYVAYDGKTPRNIGTTKKDLVKYLSDNNFVPVSDDMIDEASKFNQKTKTGKKEYWEPKIVTASSKSLSLISNTKDVLYAPGYVLNVYNPKTDKTESIFLAGESLTTGLDYLKQTILSAKKSPPQTAKIEKPSLSASGQEKIQPAKVDIAIQNIENNKTQIEDAKDKLKINTIITQLNKAKPATEQSYEAIYKKHIFNEEYPIALGKQSNEGIVVEDQIRLNAIDEMIKVRFMKSLGETTLDKLITATKEANIKNISKITSPKNLNFTDYLTLYNALAEPNINTIVETITKEKLPDIKKEIEHIKNMLNKNGIVAYKGTTYIDLQYKDKDKDDKPIPGPSSQEKLYGFYSANPNDVAVVLQRVEQRKNE